MGIKIAIGAFFYAPRNVDIEAKWWQGQGSSGK
jgi:hypothetical protein